MIVATQKIQPPPTDCSAHSAPPGGDAYKFPIREVREPCPACKPSEPPLAHLCT